MADKIKGLTVKIGANTSDFVKELKKVDKEINSTQKVANELQKGLNLEFDANRFTQAQKQVQKALSETEKKAEAIKQQLKYLEDTGAIDTDGYIKLQAELAKSETQALKLKNQLKEIDDIKFNNATKSLTDLSNGLETASKKTAILSASAIGAIAGIVKLGKDAVATGDEIQTTADKYNLSAEAIQRWNYIALQSDVSSEQLYKGMTKVRDALGTALVGETNNATNAISALVGDINDIPQNTDGAFESIIYSLSNVKDSTMQAYYANEIFGERLATDLIPLLNKSANELSGLNQEFEAVGYLSNEQVKSLAGFDNELNKVNTRLSLAKTELGIALLPILENLVNILTEKVVPAIEKITGWFNNLNPVVKDFLTNMLLLTATLSPILLIFSKIIKIIPTVITMFKSLISAITSTKIATASLLTSLGLVFELISSWKTMNGLQKVISILGILTTTVLGAAMAFGVFHSAWSMGLAVAGIIAGITAATIAINSAKNSIESQTGVPDFKVSDYNITSSDYKVPTTAGSQSVLNEDNSTYNIEINLNATGNLEYDTKQLAEEVVKQIQISKQASGR